MRLIDADKYLEKVCTYKETGCGSCKLQTMCPKDAPTVKAIPIEWFEWLLDTMGDGMYNLRAVIKDWERYKEDWGKENDRNQT